MKVLVSYLSAHHAQCLKPLNCRCKHHKTLFLSVTLHFYAMRPSSLFLYINLVPRVFVRLDQRSENERLWEQSAFTAHA